jgi:hypothetical protein
VASNGWVWAVVGAGAAATGAAVYVLYERTRRAQPKPMPTTMVTQPGGSGSSSSGSSGSTGTSTVPLTIPVQTLPRLSVGTDVSYQWTATGGIPPYTWSAIGLPPGLALYSSGQMSGAPTQQGQYLVTITVQDSTGAVAGRRTYLYVASVGSGSSSGSSVSSTSPPLEIPSQNMGQARQGQPYSYQLYAAGGRPPYTWSASGLPPGLSISASGFVSGTPSASGTYTIALRVRDSAGNSQTRITSFRVSPGFSATGSGSTFTGGAGPVPFGGGGTSSSSQQPKNPAYGEQKLQEKTKTYGATSSTSSSTSAPASSSTLGGGGGYGRYRVGAVYL